MHSYSKSILFLFFYSLVHVNKIKVTFYILFISICTKNLLLFVKIKFLPLFVKCHHLFSLSLKVFSSWFPPQGVIQLEHSTDDFLSEIRWEPLLVFNHVSVTTVHVKVYGEIAETFWYRLSHIFVLQIDYFFVCRPLGFAF